MNPSRRSDERGAIIVLTAVFAVVMVIVAALVVDIGALHDERRQLQNGADAAALGLAEILFKNCPTGPAVDKCSPDKLKDAAQDLADGNALDANTAIEPPIVDFAKQQVTVKTSTKAVNGDTILPYFFAQAFTADSGKTAHAQATATWSGLKKATVIPLTIDQCEFADGTTNGTVFGKPVVIGFHDANRFPKASCPAPKKSNSSGTDLPGGYGWVADRDSEPGDCSVTPAVGDTLSADTGVPGTPHSCDLNTLLGKDVLVPIFTNATGSGVNGAYPIYGFGEFHLTGFYFANNDKGTLPGQPLPCGPPATCIGGYFVRFVPVGEYGGTTNLGQRPALVK